MKKIAPFILYPFADASRDRIRTFIVSAGNKMHADPLSDFDNKKTFITAAIRILQLNKIQQTISVAEKNAELFRQNN